MGGRLWTVEGKEECGVASWEYTETELWRHGQENVSLFHVFGLMAVGQTVLAFSEARNGNAGDAGCTHDLWMRKSTDGGRTFAESAVLLSGAAGGCWTNPVPVYDEAGGKLFLFVSDNAGNCRTNNYILSSDDLGESWSQPEKINHLLETGEHPLPFHLAGPGHGIQLKRGAHAGRLIMPFWHRRYGVETPAAQRGYCISLLMSDDHGATWRHTNPMGERCMANETRMVETQEGLLWIVRPGGGNPCRYECRSVDGGESWSAPVPQAVGPANNCDAGAVSLSGKAGWEDMTLVSRVSAVERRWNMEILISTDGGRTFPERFCAPPGDAMPGYSDLCVLHEEEPVVGWLHCRNNHVLFSRISLQTLTGGRYEQTGRKVWLG